MATVTRGAAVPESPSRLQLGEPHYHAYVVDDIEATVSRLVEGLGAGPFFLIEGVPLENVRSRGEPATEVANLRRSLDERGLPEYLSSQFGGVETTLHDASAVLGHDIEIHVDNEGLHGFFAMVKGGAEGWDGSEPLRRVET
jgi:hypothetical protein